MRFIEVAVFCPVDTAFTYMWPEQLGDLPAPGCRVLVPFWTSNGYGTDARSQG
ncbi:MULTISPECIES: primosomal protein N' family DNA-binding protein [Pseudomonas]|uniref:primosomal protein N' family DNA-binding protein n=1 Tax=Pseudomonas TaxID=286 RepID=UPI0013564B0D